MNLRSVRTFMSMNLRTEPGFMNPCTERRLMNVGNERRLMNLGTERRFMNQVAAGSFGFGMG